MNSLVYNGKSFNQRDDNYVNLGELCATHGKRFHNWNRTQTAKDYLTALAETLAQSDAHICTPDKLIISDVDAIGGNSGTWGHPLVAIEVARWISPAFGVWCNQHVKTLIESGSTAIAQPIQPQLPQTYLEALKALVAAEEQRTLLEAEKALLEKTNLALAETVDELFDYSSILRVSKFNGVSEKVFSWHRLKAVSEQLGAEIKRVPSPRFEYQNLYSHDAWRVAYPNVRLPETTTLVVHTA